MKKNQSKNDIDYWQHKSINNGLFKISKKYFEHNPIIGRQLLEVLKKHPDCLGRDKELEKFFRVIEDSKQTPEISSLRECQRKKYKWEI